MLELALAGNAAFEACDLELRRGGLSYTVDTLTELRSRGIEDPWFILSAEALVGFPSWRQPERVLELARLAVVPRGGFATLDRRWVEERFRGRGDRVTFLPGPLLPISGSVVRRRAAAGRSVRYLVPDAVAAYIADHRLYQPAPSRIDAT
jgi:nicotinate-nucleotide adenylyltransferase